MPKIVSNGRTVQLANAAHAELVYKVLQDLGHPCDLREDIPRIDGYLVTPADMLAFTAFRSLNHKISCIKYVRERTGVSLLDGKLWVEHWIFNEENFLNIRFGT